MSDKPKLKRSERMAIETAIAVLKQHEWDYEGAGTAIHLLRTIIEQHSRPSR